MWLPEIVFVYLRINKNGESQKIKVMKNQETVLPLESIGAFIDTKNGTLHPMNHNTN